MSPRRRYYIEMKNLIQELHNRRITPPKMMAADSALKVAGLPAAHADPFLRSMLPFVRHEQSPLCMILGVENEGVWLEPSGEDLKAEVMWLIAVIESKEYES